MPPSDISKSNNRFYQLRAWSVHLYTASGLLFALLAVIEIIRDQPQWAFFYAVIAMIVDGTDGIFARRWEVKKWASQFDGRKLDDITDYLNYTFVPVLFIYQFDILPGYWILVLFFVLLASAYGFCFESAKTEDGFFTGFPSYWNAVALYLYWLKWPEWAAAFIVIMLAALTFVPSKYISLNQTMQMQRISRILLVLWGMLLVWIAVDFTQPNMLLVYISLLYPAYYFLASLIISTR